VNDYYGHLIGDRALQVFALTVKRIVRSEDIFCRYGGDEFLLYVKNIDENDILKLAERIRIHVQNQIINYEDANVKITCSIGVSPINANEHINSNIDRVDIALYKAKEKGKNRVHLERN
jgi:diguanylate cyclase (GGDEF)-like protein